MNELEFRKDIIEGFRLIIANMCKECRRLPEECSACLFFKAAENGHLNVLQDWLQKKKAEDLPRTICLVGSTRREWKKRYRQVEEELSKAGFVVVSVVWFRGQLPHFEKHRELLERIHFQKIRIAHAVVLIHPDAKGKHTKIEMAFAKEIGKPVLTFKHPKQTIQRLRNLFEKV